MLACPECKAENPERYKICQGCGAFPRGRTPTIFLADTVASASAAAPVPAPTPASSAGTVMIKCSACGRLNKPGYKHCFSMQCGMPAGDGQEVVVGGAAAAKTTCPKCAAQNDTGYAFCRACGERPAAGSAPSSPRPEAGNNDAPAQTTTVCGRCGVSNVGDNFKFCRGCGEPPPKQTAAKQAEAGAKFGAALRKTEPAARDEDESPRPQKPQPEPSPRDSVSESPRPKKVQPEPSPRDSGGTQKCAECGKQNARGYKFCKSCGAPPPGESALKVKALDASPRDSGAQTCPECGKSNLKGYRFCKGCGAAPPSDTPTPAPRKPEPSPRDSAGAQTCPECGRSNVKGYRFCKSCGAAPPGEAPAKKQPQPEPSPRDSVSESPRPKKVQPEPSPRDSGGTQKCGECGKQNARGYKFCKSCGAPPPGESALKVSPRESGTQTCVECGNSNPQGARFCKRCGAAPGGGESAPKAKAAESPRKSDAPMKKQPEPSPRDSGGTVKCPECGKGNARDFKFCKSCGAPSPSEAAPASKPRDASAQACSACGKSNAKGFRFCQWCGAAPGRATDEDDQQEAARIAKEEARLAKEEARLAKEEARLAKLEAEAALSAKADMERKAQEAKEEQRRVDKAKAAAQEEEQRRADKQAEAERKAREAARQEEQRQKAEAAQEAARKAEAERKQAAARAKNESLSSSSSSALPKSLVPAARVSPRGAVMSDPIGGRDASSRSPFSGKKKAAPNSPPAVHPESRGAASPRDEGRDYQTKPLCVPIICTHLRNQKVKVVITQLDGLTAGALKIGLAVKLKGPLPDGYLSVFLSGQADGEAPIQLEDEEDVTEILLLATEMRFNLGRTKRQVEDYRAAAFQRARGLREQGLIMTVKDDPEIEVRVREHRFKSILRVKKERKQLEADGGGRRRANGLKSPPPPHK